MDTAVVGAGRAAVGRPADGGARQRTITNSRLRSKNTPIVSSAGSAPLSTHNREPYDTQLSDTMVSW